MPHFDFSLDALREYRPDLPRPADFDGFWRQTLSDARTHPLQAAFTPVEDSIYRQVRVLDVRFAGFGGQAVCGWLLLPMAVAAPANAKKLPCIVTYVGYGGGRGLPVSHLAPCAAGFAHFVMDTRGQGSGWSSGGTPDDAGPLDPQFPGFMTRGVSSPQTYYYRRVFVDAARAIEAAAAHPEIDPTRIIVSGTSQGGGIAIAAAALAAERVCGLCADVPFLCHFRRATTIVDTSPYNEIAKYLACHRDRIERVYETLSYFDAANFAPQVQCPVMFSVGLMDQVCPPSTVFAAYNRLPRQTRKSIQVYDFNAHEGGGELQTVERLKFALATLAKASAFD